MLIRAFGWLALALLIAACDPSPPSGQGSPDSLSPSTSESGSESKPPPMPAGQLGDAVVPVRYVLDLTIVPERERFSGTVEIELDIREPAGVIWLHGNRLDVRSAWLEQGETRIEAGYEQVDETGIARLDLAATPMPGHARLHIEYDAPFDTSLEGLYKVTEDGRDYAFTQFEATSARLAFPGFDEPAFKAPFEIHVTAPGDQRVITATPEIARNPVGQRLVRRSYAVTPPLPTYLIAFAVGPLDVVEWQPVEANEVRDRPLPLRGVAVAGKGGQLEFALENTARIVHALERYFDYPFPYPKLDIIAVPDFAAGAMENVGAITYREPLLLLDENASIGRKRAYASVHAHELAHQWFGNLVTPKWWDDIWLNESFATWMAYKAAAAAFPDYGFEDRMLGRAIGVMDSDALESARQVRQSIESNHDIANAFDGITYAKGGAVLSMFESWLGEAAFRAGVRLHMRRFEHDVADYQDFLTSLAEGAGKPEVVEAFSSFLFQPGVPLISAELACGEDIELIVTQSRYLPLGSTAERGRIWQLPVCVRYGSGDESARHCELVETAMGALKLPADSCPDWVMPNDDGAGYYRFSLDEAGWDALVANLDRLNERESRVLLDSISASYRSGDMTTEELVDAGRMLAGHPDREVATAPIDDVTFLYDRLAESEAARAGVAEMLRELYAERLAALGVAARKSDSTDDALLRASLAGVLIDEGEDAALRARLADMAGAYLDDLAIEREMLDPGLVGTMLTAAVRERDPVFAEELFGRMMKSTDSTFRRRALGALGASRDAEVGAMLRAHIGDERLRDNEAIAIAFGQVGNAHQREAMWDWAQDEDNLETLLARIPTWRKGAIVALGSGFCSHRRAEEVEEMFGERVEDLEGGPRSLAQTLERIRLCAALRTEYAQEVTAMFSPSPEVTEAPEPGEAASG
ncbi:MAG: M1 family metallopeptidase [Wenzhouxiangellaceae bacterium]|nr:M1 family metallopeptidase [Wenzhouxiangellaceae bacterium]